MRRAALPVLALALLAACTQLVPAPDRTPHASTPTGLATSAPASPAVAPRSLRKPSGDVRALTGTVAIDATYALRKADARLLSNNGAGALVVGASLLSEGGNGVIANNAGNLLGEGGANVISDLGAAYHVLETAPSPTPGAVLPAGGMRLAAYGLLDGKPLSLGQDDAGKPVQAVLTRPDGGYTIYLPAGITTNVRLEATVPRHDDPRLAYNGLVSAAAATRSLDEDVSNGATFVRGVVFAEMIADYTIGVAAPDRPSPTPAFAGTPPPEIVESNVQRDRWQKKLIAIGFPKLDEATRRAAARRSADAVLAHVDLDAIMIVPGDHYQGPVRPALVALDDILKQVRELTAKQFQAATAAGQDPIEVFSSKPYVQRANARDHTTYRIERPSDLPALMLTAVVTNTSLTEAERQQEILALLVDLELDADVTTELATIVKACEDAIFDTLYHRGNQAIDDAVAAIGPL